MLKNYFEIDENTTVSSFLRELNEKKNSQYIILDSDSSYFVDLRNVALTIKDPKEKLKSLKKSLPKSDGNTQKDYLIHLIKTGDRVIETSEGLFDFLDGLTYILEENFDFLKQKVSTIHKKEIIALTGEEKISTAKKLLSDNKINLLPIIKDKLDIIGEVRTRDFLTSNLFNNDMGRGDYYSEKASNSPLNLKVENLMNKKPHILNINSTIKDAIKLMIDKFLPSLIVHENNKLYSVISYKDIFKLVQSNLEDKKYNIEFIGASNLYEDELESIQKFAQKSMDKISKFSNYDNLKITFKTVGNTEGTHMRKFEIKLLLSHGNKIINVENEVSTGTNDETYNDKQKESFNIPQLVQETFKSLESKVKLEKEKQKR